MTDKITDPGKFEGEPTYVPYFWAMDDEDDCYEDIDGNCIREFFVAPKDEQRFPDLRDVYKIELWEDEQGFVRSICWDRS